MSLINILAITREAQQEERQGAESPLGNLKQKPFNIKPRTKTVVHIKMSHDVVIKPDEYSGDIQRKTARTSKTQ